MPEGLENLGRPPSDENEALPGNPARIGELAGLARAAPLAAARRRAPTALRLIMPAKFLAGRSFSSAGPLGCRRMVATFVGVPLRAGAEKRRIGVAVPELADEALREDG